MTMELDKIIDELDFYIGSANFNNNSNIILSLDRIQDLKSFIKKQADEINDLSFKVAILEMKYKEIVQNTVKEKNNDR